MLRLSNKQATAYAIVTLLLTLALTYFLPGYTITLSGFLIVIFLSVFIDDTKSTVIATVFSIVVVLALLFYPAKNIDAQLLTEHLFMVFLIIFTTILVLYIKRLLRQVEFDKSHMTSLFENATEGIILTNHSGNIILANPAAERMFDYSAEEIIGRPVEILIPSNYRKGHIQLREQFYHHPQHRSMGSGRDLRAQKKDGSKFPVEVSLSYYYRGNERFVIAFIVDITHRKEIEESMRLQQLQLEEVSDEIRNLNAELEVKVEERTLILKEALQKLEQSQLELSEALDKERQLNEIKSRFVSMASHEFRTPLSAVLSSASLIGKYTTAEQQPNRDKHINRIKDSVKQLNDLLEDFLSLGKLDEGKVGAQLSTLDIKDFIEDTIEDLRGLTKDGQNIVYHNSGGTLIHSDKKLLKNILINLITNAIKFSNENDEITVKSSVDKKHAVISVADKGIGISKEDQQHLFSSFFRGKNAVNIQGTGLGLHIVKRYLDIINGSIKLDSVLGQGTTITITIPVNLKEDEQHNISH
jgi:PAS domain S-box-containing protein